MEVTERRFELDPDSLTRHAVCLGMTGSGKTGLCVTLLEELSIAGIPLIIIDPKGDMANLALAFTEMESADFEPWIDDADAHRQGISVSELATKTANRWKEGLEEWDVDAQRVAAFTEKSDVQIYTPGSHSATPVNILGTFTPPHPDVLQDPEALAELIRAMVSGLLALVGVDADPVTEPSHIVLSKILMQSFQAGHAIDLEGLILKLLDPPFERAGVFPVDTFYPRKDRMKLAMILNGLVASPSFSAWREGVTLDVDALLSSPNGKAPVRVFYLAHLEEGARQFFSAMLLSRVLAWSRRQSGTSRLRALVYFDEVFGYLPPYPKNPPTKNAVLTLMKQARAVGVGTMLVTQNPVDVDYSALSNAGLWLVSRLQTAQDRDRVLDGLVSAQGGVDRKLLSQWLASMPTRTFLVRDVKRAEPVLIHSRWAISYLKGPLTPRDLVRLKATEPEGAEELSAPVASPMPPPPPPLGTLAGQPPPMEQPASRADSDGSIALSTAPGLPAGLQETYLSPDVAFSSRFRLAVAPYLPQNTHTKSIIWHPAVYAVLALRFDEGRDFVKDQTEHRLVFENRGQWVFLEEEFPATALHGKAPARGKYTPLPAALTKSDARRFVHRAIVDHFYKGEEVTIYRNRTLKLTSWGDETLQDFQARVLKTSESKANDKIARLKERLDREVTSWEKRRGQLLHSLEKQRVLSQGRATEEVIGAAETLYGLFVGGRRRTLTSVARRRRQTVQSQKRISQIEEKIADYELGLEEKRDEFEQEINEIRAEAQVWAEDIEPRTVRLERDDIRIERLDVIWLPSPATAMHDGDQHDK
jgi:hypothetical protein